MAFSAGLGFTASSLIRYRLSAHLASSFVSVSRSSRRFSELRFISSSPRRASRAVKAKRREEPVREERDGGDEGNGSLVLKERNGRDGKIVPTELHKEATEAYMAYAMSVLLGRALPDVRDGLKPVHRRILFAMHELGLSSRKPFKKCARVFGEFLGKFHPHGDTAVCDTFGQNGTDFTTSAFSQEDGGSDEQVVLVSQSGTVNRIKGSYSDEAGSRR